MHASELTFARQTKPAGGNPPARPSRLGRPSSEGGGGGGRRTGSTKGSLAGKGKLPLRFGAFCEPVPAKETISAWLEEATKRPCSVRRFRPPLAVATERTRQLSRRREEGRQEVVTGRGDKARSGRRERDTAEKFLQAQQGAIDGAGFLAGTTHSTGDERSSELNTRPRSRRPPRPRAASSPSYSRSVTTTVPSTHTTDHTHSRNTHLPSVESHAFTVGPMDAAAWTPNSQSQRRKRPAKPASDSGSKGDTGKRVLMACLCCRRRCVDLPPPPRASPR